MNKPFAGSFGLISIDGIPKPNFWGFKMLKELYPKRLELPYGADDVEVAAFVDGNKTQVLVYAQNAKPDIDEQFAVRLNVNAAAKHVGKKVIANTHCNPKAEWIKLGKPDILTPSQVGLIKLKTKLAEQNADFTVSGGNTNIEFTMRTNDVVMFTIE